MGYSWSDHSAVGGWHCPWSQVCVCPPPPLLSFQIFSQAGDLKQCAWALSFILWAVLGGKPAHSLVGVPSMHTLSIITCLFSICFQPFRLCSSLWFHFLSLLITGLFPCYSLLSSWRGLRWGMGWCMWSPHRRKHCNVKPYSCDRWRDREGVVLSEVRQTETEIIWFHLPVEY